MRYMLLLLLTLACGSRPDHGRELAACQLISKSGDELARCLIMKYSWDADSAGPAKASFQWMLDSIRAEHDAQVDAILAQQQAILAKQQAREQAREESLGTVERRRAAALAVRQEKLDTIDARFWACDGAYILDYIAHMNQERRDSGRVQCLKERATALRRWGFPPNALPDPEP